LSISKPHNKLTRQKGGKQPRPSLEFTLDKEGGLRHSIWIQITKNVEIYRGRGVPVSLCLRLRR